MEVDKLSKRKGVGGNEPRTQGSFGQAHSRAVEEEEEESWDKEGKEQKLE